MCAGAGTRRNSGTKNREPHAASQNIYRNKDSARTQPEQASPKLSFLPPNEVRRSDLGWGASLFRELTLTPNCFLLAFPEEASRGKLAMGFRAPVFFSQVNSWI